MFRFHFHGNPFSHATKSMAKGALIIGLLLIGFGMLVFVLGDIFIFLAAAIFFLAGFSAIGYSIRLFLVHYKMKKSNDVYRENVEIHYEDTL